MSRSSCSAYKRGLTPKQHASRVATQARHRSKPGTRKSKDARKAVLRSGLIAARKVVGEWTDSETLFVEAFFLESSYPEIARALGRSYASVEKKCMRMGLRKVTYLNVGGAK